MALTDADYVNNLDIHSHRGVYREVHLDLRSAAQFLDQHAGVFALLALVVAWLVYRIDRWSERRGVIRGLEAELDMHGAWVGNQYNESHRGTWPDPDYLVFKLVTVALDNAIARGPSLFLNRDLSITLVRYSQVVGHFNQLIDRLMAFQATPELWSPHPPAHMVAYAVGLIKSIHIGGIGDASMWQPASAYVFYMQVTNPFGAREGLQGPATDLANDRPQPVRVEAPRQVDLT